MSWFGGGGKKKDDVTGGANYMDGGGSSSVFDGHGPSSSVAGGGSGMALGGGADMAEFQQFSISLQQQVLVHQVISDLTDQVISKCMAGSTPKDHYLTGKEVACISAATNKYLDANEYIMGRMARKQEQASKGQF